MSTIDIETMEKAKEARRAYQRAWRAANPDKVRDSNMRYWAKRAQREADAVKGAGDQEAANG